MKKAGNGSFISKIRISDVFFAVIAIACLCGGGYYLITDAPWPRGGGSLNSTVSDGGRVQGAFVSLFALWAFVMLFKNIKNRGGD